MQGVSWSSLPTRFKDRSKDEVVTDRVREEDGPLVTNELVEVDATVGGVGIEVGCGRPETEAAGQC